MLAEVGFAADVVERAQIYAVASHNRSLLRLHIAGSSGAMQLSSEVVLPGGRGADGPLGAASALDPSLCAWARGSVLLADGCALRQVDVQGGRVRTLVGMPDQCAAVQPSGGSGNEPEERLEPVAWASVLSRPLALAGPAEATAGGAPALLLTGAEVVQVDIRPSPCEGLASGACEEAHGCGWAAGPGAAGACLDCGGLERTPILNLRRLAKPTVQCL
ncbi:unnamed protein product [Prorocentrum cordatum]|uniref:Uncharacterized protein n=1 Tax=Prorocentrum cordatum TaxID=2364126 RepID=A0ABN9PL38_9DINO|nr:unnamed protein product [Polarella glacialis]